MQNWQRYWVHETFFFFQNEKSHALNYANSCNDAALEDIYVWGLPNLILQKIFTQVTLPKQHGRQSSETSTISTKALQSWSVPLARQTQVSDAQVKWLARPNHRLPSPPVSPHMSWLAHRHRIPPLLWMSTYRRHDPKLGSATTARKSDILWTIAQSPASSGPKMNFQKGHLGYYC